VVVQAVGHEFDDAAATAAARAVERAAHAFHHRDDVVAVHLQAVQAAGDAFLGQRRRAGLRRARHRDRPAVVDDALHEGQGVRACGIDRGVGVGLGAAAVAAGGHRDARLLAQLERERGPGRVQALGGDRHAPGKVVLRHGEVVAALVAAPVQQHFARTHAAHELRAILAVARCEHVFGAHRRAYPDMGGFVAETGRVGAELAGALQGDGFAVEAAHHQHLLEQRQQGCGIGEGRRRFRDERAVLAEVLQVFDFESCYDSHRGAVCCVGPRIIPVAPEASVAHRVMTLAVRRRMAPGPQKSAAGAALLGGDAAIALSEAADGRSAAVGVALTVRRCSPNRPRCCCSAAGRWWWSNSRCWSCSCCSGRDATARHRRT